MHGTRSDYRIVQRVALRMVEMAISSWLLFINIEEHWRRRWLVWLPRCCLLPATRHPSRATLLLPMQSLLHFFGVAFVVEFQQALQDFTAGDFADGEADALLYALEAMAEIKVIPAVGSGDCLIQLDV